MPPKRDTSRSSQSDSGPINDLSQNELRRLIWEEIKATIKDEVDTLSSRLGNIEQQMKLLKSTNINYPPGWQPESCDP